MPITLDVVSHPVLDLLTARRWAVTARVMLAAARERIDALNVFPVPDGDTGTNMFLTMDGSLDFVRSQFELGLGTDRLDEGLGLIARGMLLSARGNSGIILAQLTRGLADAVGPDVEAAGPAELARAFESAAQTAWDALAAPVEGTILSVARAAAEGARAAVDRGHALYDDGSSQSSSPSTSLHVLHVINEALDAARSALARTPEQLPQLRDAGVVDAGGAGLVLVIEALQAVLDERPHLAVSDLPDWWEPGWWDFSAASKDEPGPSPDPGQHCAPVTPGEVEVMYLLTDSDPDRADRLRAHLARLGNSVAIAGGPVDYRIHVHLQHPRLAVEAGTFAGRVSDVRMTSLDDGEEMTAEEVPEADRPSLPLGIVACALGAGAVGLFEDAGAQVVLSGPRSRASTGQLLAAMLSCHAHRIVVLPNDADTVLVAQAAAREARAQGLAVDVIPTLTLVQGMAALAVHDPAGEPAQVIDAMGQAAAGMRSAALSKADRDADTPAGRCRQGQWLGIIDQHIVAVADELAPVGRAVLDRLWHDEVEILTILTGAPDSGADESAVQELRRAIAEAQATRAQIEVVHLEGGQPAYPFLLGIE